jgi:hypothetical protein
MEKKRDEIVARIRFNPGEVRRDPSMLVQCVSLNLATEILSSKGRTLSFGGDGDGWCEGKSRDSKPSVVTSFDAAETCIKNNSYNTILVACLPFSNE